MDDKFNTSQEPTFGVIFSDTVFENHKEIRKLFWMTKLFSQTVDNLSKTTTK